MLPIRTILFPTDLSECCESVFRVACSLAYDYGARLIVLHVVEPTFLYGEMGIPLPHPGGDAALEEQVRRHRTDLRVRVEYQVREGVAADEVLRLAREVECDLIVMGTHGRTGLGRLLMGSVAEEVVRRAVCPVLTLKSPPGAADPESRAEPAELASVSH